MNMTTYEIDGRAASDDAANRHTDRSATNALPRWAKLSLWGLQVLAAAAFFAAGGAKLAGVPDMVAMFEAMGFGQWFRYFTGGYEVLGALLLVIPRTAWAGASMFVVQMLAAVFVHLALVGGSAVPALVPLVATALIAWYRRPARR